MHMQAMRVIKDAVQREIQAENVQNAEHAQIVKITTKITMIWIQKTMQTEYPAQIR